MLKVLFCFRDIAVFLINNENQNTIGHTLFSSFMTHLFSLGHVSLPYPFLSVRLKKSISGVSGSMSEIPLLAVIR